jgi:glucose-like phosphotransferase system IIB component
MSKFIERRGFRTRRIRRALAGVLVSAACVFGSSALAASGVIATPAAAIHVPKGNNAPSAPREVEVAPALFRELASGGPYSVVRNPLYVGTFVGVVGLGFAVHQPALGIVLGAVFGLSYPAVIAEEEANLGEGTDSATAVTAAGSGTATATMTAPVAAGNKAEQVILAFGGRDNLVNVDACITRLRVEVNDKGQVDQARLKSLGAAGVIEVGNSVQAVFGTDAEALKNDINDIL